MSTNTFDRRLEITDPEAVKKLYKLMTEDVPDKTPASRHSVELEEGKKLLKEYLDKTKARNVFYEKYS